MKGIKHRKTTRLSMNGIPTIFKKHDKSQRVENKRIIF